MKRAKAAEVAISVLRFGGRVVRLKVASDATIKQAIEDAGFTVKPTDQVLVNEEEISKSELDEALVDNGDSIVLTPKIEGGVK